MATRFVLTKECDVSDAYKQAYLDARKEDIVIIKSPVGMPGRAIRNRFVDRLLHGETIGDESCDSCLKNCGHEFCIAERLNQARLGNIDEGLVFSGENVWKIKDIPTVREVFDRLVAEAESFCEAPAPAIP
jgi:NAD(P)H-dependent flavin oxidoreductase YrpB (nitropropane dioxygenase family)